MDTILSFGAIAAVIGLIVLVVGTIFIVKCVSMYKKSEEDRRYDDMLSKPLEKFKDDHADKLAEKYNTESEGDK